MKSLITGIISFVRWIIEWKSRGEDKYFKDDRWDNW